LREVIDIKRGAVIGIHIIQHSRRVQVTYCLNMAPALG